MKAMILAAGLGTRLRPLTDHVPKPMLKIGDKPLLEHQINLLKKYGVNNFGMNLHYFPKTIKDYFGDGSKFGVKIRYSFEEELLGTAGAVKKMESLFLDGTFALFYGDNLTDINLDKMYSFHKKNNSVITIALYFEEHPESKGIVLLDEDNRITRFVEKPKKEEIVSNWANAGIYICEPQILKLIPKNKFFDFGFDLFPVMISNNIPMYGYKMDEILLDIGTHESFLKAQELISSLKI